MSKAANGTAPDVDELNLPVVRYESEIYDRSEPLGVDILATVSGTAEIDGERLPVMKATHHMNGETFVTVRLPAGRVAPEVVASAISAAVTVFLNRVSDEAPTEPRDQMLANDQAQDVLEVEANIFDQPSGQVRGIVNGFLKINGKRRRLAHATLLVDAPTVISLDVPGARMRSEDVQAVTTGLQQFAERLEVYEKKVPA